MGKGGKRGGGVIYVERDLYLAIAARSSLDGTKMGKGPDGSDGFDFDSRGEGKGKGKKSREVIKLEAVFHSGPRDRIATCQSLTFQCPLGLPSFRAVQLPFNISPRALREFGRRPALILPLDRNRSPSHAIASPGTRPLFVHTPAFG